jgi:effector-binding domain-containing protein
MPYPCELTDYAAQTTVSIRVYAPVQKLREVLGQAYGAIMQYLAEIGEQPAGPPFVAYYNMDMQNLDLEVGFPVRVALPGRNNIKASRIPAGKMAACLHTGPYADLPHAYESLQRWMGEHGYEASGAAYEVYLNDPQTTPPDALQTQVMIRLKVVSPQPV